MDCNINQAVNILKYAQNIIILTHKNPDGDALGSSFALYYSLSKMGKNATVMLDEEFPKGYDFLYPDYVPKKFEEKFIISVDLADTNLLSDNLKGYAQRVDLAIDHHPSNTNYSKERILNPNSAATAELLFDIIRDLIGIDKIDAQIATCLYLGIVTDTGCFKFSNTTSNTHKIAAQLIDLGASHIMVNKRMFDTKSIKKLELEQDVISKIEYHFGGKCALIYITQDMIKNANVLDSELEGMSSIPTQIEGVEIGITIKEKEYNMCKISVRTSENYDASEICEYCGGGGHKRAGGCTVQLNIQDAKVQILNIVDKILRNNKN